MKKMARLNQESLKYLEKFITSDDNPKFFFTMTQINKIGINPRSQYNTPLGIYCYPLTAEYYKKLITNSLPFAGTQPYINLFTLNVPTFNMTNYTESDLKRDTNTVRFIYGIPTKQMPANDTEDIPKVAQKKFTEQDITHAFYNANQQNPQSKMWNLTRIFSGNMRNWNHLLRKLGYTNFYDPGTSLIHPNEPVQAVILDPTVIIKIETFYNPNVDLYDSSSFLSRTEKSMLAQKRRQEEKLYNKIEEIESPQILNKLLEHYINNGNIISALLNNQKLEEGAIEKILANINNYKPEIANSIFGKISSKSISESLLLQVLSYPHLESYSVEKLYYHNPKYNNLISMSLYTSPNDYIRAEVASKTKNEDIIKKLSKDKSTYVITNIIRNSNINENILEDLVDAGSLDAINDICALNSLSNSLIDKIFEKLYILSKTEDAWKITKCIVGLANNRNISSKKLEEISSRYYDYEDIASSILNNPNANKQVYENLAKSKNYVTLSKLTQKNNDNVTSELLNNIVNSLEKEISNAYTYFDSTFKNIAKNNAVTEDILYKLSFCNSSGILSTILDQAGLLSERITNNIFNKALEAHLQVMDKLLYLPILSEKQMIEFISKLSEADEFGAGKLYRLGLNAKLTENVADALLKTNKRAAFNGLAANRSSPKYVLDYLAENGDSVTLSGLSANNIISEENIITIFNRIKSDDSSGLYYKDLVIQNLSNSVTTPGDILYEIYNYGKANDKQSIMSNAIYNKNFPIDILKNLAKEGDERTKIFIANKSNAPIEILQELARDANKYVADRATYTLRYSFPEHQVNKNASKKMPISTIKKLPYKTLMRIIDQAKEHLKKDGVMQEIFKEKGVDINEIDLIPTFFKDLDVSAKTDHGIVYLNYKLLQDGFDLKDCSYLIHEYTHWADQTTGDKPTQSSDDGNYLDNPFEIDGFSNQIEYLAKQLGVDEAEDYVNNLLEYHDIDEDKVEDKKEELMAKV